MRLLTKTLSPRIVRDKPPTLSADALLSLGDTHGAHITAEALALGDSSGLGVPLARHTRRAVAHLARLARAERRARGAGSAALGRDEAKAVRGPRPVLAHKQTAHERLARGSPALRRDRVLTCAHPSPPGASVGGQA
jgi:hypothetical protein